MANVLRFDFNDYFIFFIILVRISGLFFTAPILSARNVPVRIRAGMALILSLITFSIIPNQGRLDEMNVADYFLIVSRELMIGLLLGIVPRIMFAAIEFGGTVIGFLMGFAVVNVVDPQTQTQVSIIASLKTVLATLLFVVLDGHHIFFHALTKSYELIPFAGFQFSSQKIDIIIRLSADMILLGLKLGAPLIVALLLANVIMGFLARSVPQLNVFIVGFPFTIGLGLVFLMLGMPFMIESFTQLFFTATTQISDLLTIMAR